MYYETALEKIHSLSKFGSRPGLSRLLMLLDRIGNPQDRLNFIHVAGTNGKGSVCSMLSSILAQSGLKTGLFISPYITDFRERIQINNEPVCKRLFDKAVAATFPEVEKLLEEGVVITEFEYINALEFYIHLYEHCDIVVLEAGMGGLLDSTNVIPSPLCSVLTKIALDHTEVLGSTVSVIAAQKCGIIKEGSIAVSSTQSRTADSVIKGFTQRLSVPLYRSSDVKIRVLSQTLERTVLRYGRKDIILPLIGDHQIENARTAIATVEALNETGILDVSLENIQKGLSSVFVPARLELVSKSPIVLIDGAHNPNGIRAMLRAVKKYLPDKQPIALFGMLADKDTSRAAELMRGMFDEVVTVTVNNPRAMTADILSDRLRLQHIEVKPFGKILNGFSYAYSKALFEDKPLIVFGSLYLAAEIRKLFDHGGLKSDIRERRGRKPKGYKKDQSAESDQGSNSDSAPKE